MFLIKNSSKRNFFFQWNFATKILKKQSNIVIFIDIFRHFDFFKENNEK